MNKKMLTAPALGVALLLTGCTTGWEGEATVAELEHEEAGFEKNRKGQYEYQFEAYELDLVLPDGRELELEVDEDCYEELHEGQRLSHQEFLEECEVTD